MSQLKDKECVECGTTFKSSTKNQKYCASKCRNKRNARNHRHSTISNTVIKNGAFEGSDRSYAIKRGLEDAKRIQNCSVECLLEELGDIE